MTYHKIDIQKIADQRSLLHKNHISSRRLSTDYDYIGLAGEDAFGRQFNLAVDISLRVGGDKGIDFILSNGLTVDVKTFRKAFNLIHEVGKIKADIYVLAQFNDMFRNAILIGWIYGYELLKSPTKDFGYGIINYYMPANKLYSMDIFIKKCQL